MQQPFVIDETIVAQATPAGRGGVGIVRVSGPLAGPIAKKIARIELKPRFAHYVSFVTPDEQLIDQGLCLFFLGPHSFTGEDVVEFHGHGGAIVQDRLIKASIALGARLARPGEFSERAYLNGKIDLAQAEAIADLIDASTEQAATSALRSLQGDFSKQVQALSEALIHLRVYVEAAIDFSEEEIDFLAEEQLLLKLCHISDDLSALFAKAKQGSLLREGKFVVIVGEPNAGKSSLLNLWAGFEAAIVTDIPGTTRDLIQATVQVHGVPIHVIDTAGLRLTSDVVENKGIEKAKGAIEKADWVIWLRDPLQEDTNYIQESLALFDKPILKVFNKSDVSGNPAGIFDDVAFISAKTGEGFEAFLDWLRQKLDVEVHQEGTFLARRRHLDALERSNVHLESAKAKLREKALELVAEELKMSASCLQEITGTFTHDALLGQIFSSFCVGK